MFHPKLSSLIAMGPNSIIQPPTDLGLQGPWPHHHHHSPQGGRDTKTQSCLLLIGIFCCSASTRLMVLDM